MYASSRPRVNGAPECSRRRIDAGDETLRRRLFVSRRAVDLSGQEESRARGGSRASPQLGRLDEVVLDRVPGPQDHRVFEPGKCVDQLGLDLRREAHREAVDVDLVGVDPFRLEKDLVPLPIGEIA